MFTGSLSIFLYQYYVNLTPPYSLDMGPGQKFLKCCHILKFHISLECWECEAGTLRLIVWKLQSP